MKDDALLAMLEQAVESLSIKLGYEDLRKGEVNTDGGLFLLRGEKRILVHKGLKVKDRVDVLTRILASLDTDRVHLPPAVRKRIEQAKKGSEKSAGSREEMTIEAPADAAPPAPPAPPAPSTPAMDE
jgi:hypothetical protein